MLPGISGSLIAGTFLNDVLVDEFSRREVVTRTAGRLAAWWRRVDRAVGPASGLRLVADVAALPLCGVLGCRIWKLEPFGNVMNGTIAGASDVPVVLCVTHWGRRLDEAWRIAVTAGRAAGSTWALIYSGNKLQIVDARRTWAHRAIDIDLRFALTEERGAVAVAALLHAAIAREDDEAALQRLAARSEKHGVKVCEALGAGVMEALSVLARALDDAHNRPRRARVPEAAVFEQSITIVYRLLFLLFAEARGAVPTWHHVYRASYTIDALLQRSASGRSPRGLWKTLQAISRLAHAGCRAGDLVVTPFNGRLFSPRHTPLAESCRVADAVVGEAVTSLATTRGRAGRERIAYADLDIEQLGAVYERVLEYEPQRSNAVLLLTRTSHDRKSSGSFYTPRAMTDFLVRRALHPLVANRTADEILALRVLDPAMGSGAFLVSACRFLAKAIELARAAERAVAVEPSESERASIRRLVAQRCLFGVDRNPMAVQLARLSLWLCTLSADRPLTFLDHHLVGGDSLIGASFSDLARSPRRRRPGGFRREPLLPLFDAGQSGQFADRVLPDRFRLAMTQEHTPDDVREKERVLATLSSPGTPLATWKRAADLWCAPWFWDDDLLRPAVYADVAAALCGGGGALPQRQVDGIAQRAAAIAAAHRFFHWELEFPEVFFTPLGPRDPNGGFDCVLGNPPWDMLRADDGTDEARRHARREQSARLRFLRQSGIYQCQGGGHANCYQLFLERALQLARPEGRVAMIVPSGLATDHGSGLLRRRLFDTMRIERLVGFDNRAAIFPIHRDVKFLLLTGTKGQVTDRIVCAFGHSDAAWLDQLPDAAADDPPEARPIDLSQAMIASLDPDHHSVPLLKSAVDLEILSSVLAAVPKLSEQRGWHVTFGRELNATDDRPDFRPLSGAFPRVGNDVRESDLLTIVEGKHVEPFRVRVGASAAGIARAQAAQRVDPARTFERSRIAYRDVASATNRVTLIAGILPPGTISTHTVFCSKTALAEGARYCLLALLNSLAANYLVRLQVTTHVTAALMARLPVPKPAAAASDYRELASLARALEQSGIAGHEPLYARVNAISARLYGLTRDQYQHVVSTFPLLPPELRSECLLAYH
jgi:hypothetical protein